nr:MAG TPA: hypothetical protein [Caudoviricetes sp.]DAZ04061.1 MAG TPA: hypothetical protein [Caudoviricetes sp.]
MVLLLFPIFISSFHDYTTPLFENCQYILKTFFAFCLL